MHGGADWKVGSVPVLRADPGIRAVKFAAAQTVGKDAKTAFSKAAGIFILYVTAA